MDKISCKMCGSNDLTAKGNLIICNSCGSKFVDDGNSKAALQQDIDHSLHADLIFDFIITEKAMSNIFYQWLISGAYTPDDILQKFKHLQLKKVFLPTYLFNGSYLMNWSASSGYNYEEKYQEWDNYRKEYVTKKRTLTDWRPSSGSVQDNFSEMIVANSTVASNLANFIGASATFLGKDGTPFDCFDTTNCTLLPYMNDENKAFDVAKLNLDKKISAQIIGQIPGDTYKDLNWNGQTSHRTCKVYYPAYLGSFEYSGKTFSYIIDGRNEKNIFGEKPIEENRVQEAKQSFIPLQISAWFTPILTGCFMLSSETLLGLIYGVLGIILSFIFYYSGKRKMISVSENSQIRRLTMLKILQDDLLSESDKKQKLDECLKGNLPIKLSQEEIIQAQKNIYAEDENSSSVKINAILLNKQHGRLVLSFAFTFIIGCITWVISMCINA